MSRRGVSARARLVLAAAVAIAGLSGCASLGGNIKGSFSCKAPDGVCAPSSSIDDRALAMITGDEGAGATPAGPYLEERTKGDRSTRTTVSAPRRTPIQADDAARTQEKVLRIVFQPFIDERGRLHEASAVHTVVAQGEWQQQAIAGAAPIPPANRQASLPPSQSLAEAVEQAGDESVAVIDPDLPDPAVVAAARARAGDPVAAIKADVAARVAPKPTSAAGTRREAKPTQVPQGDPKSAAASASARTEKPPVAASVVAAATGAQSAGPSANPPKIKAASEATARVKADERYVAASRKAQEGARKAASQSSLPDLKPVLKPTVTTVDFPGAVPEDN